MWGYSDIVPLKLVVRSHVWVSAVVRGYAMALAGPLDNIHRVAPKPLLCCLGCVLQVIVLLEDEPLAQFEVLSPLD